VLVAGYDAHSTGMDLFYSGLLKISPTSYSFYLQVARMSGTGEQLFTVITNNHPSTATMLRANRLYVDNCPYIKLTYFFSMKSILDAFEGATHVHVINYGLLFGIEFPSLIQHLSLRSEGPPQFRLTGALKALISHSN